MSRSLPTFAWDQGQQLEIEITERAESVCTAACFFASAPQFTRFFTPKEGSEEVYLEFDHARIMDSSALEAVEVLAGRYRDLGKQFHVRGLSENCDKLLRRKDGNVTMLPLEEFETV